MDKIIIFLAEGFEEIEALTVVDVLRRAEIKCEICSLGGEFVTGSHGITVKADIQIETADMDSYSGLVLPGGMPGAKNLMENNKIIQLVRSFHNQNKLIAAICAAPIVLNKAGIIKNVSLTSYPGVRDQLIECAYEENIVVEHKNIITSRGPATAIEFSLRLVEKIKNVEAADELRNGMLVNFFEDKIKCAKKY